MKTTRMLLAAAVMMGSGLLGVPAAGATLVELEQIEGTWTARLHTDDDRSARITLSRWDDDRDHWRGETSLPDDLVRDILAQAERNDGVVAYEVEREAGTLAFEGNIRGDGGSGTFQFTPRPEFLTEMSSLGYSGLDEGEVFAAAVHDVGPRFVQEMSRLGFQDLDFDELLPAAIFDVNAEFIAEMRAVGLGDLPMEKLVSFRIFEVDAAFVREARALGFDLDEDDLVAMKIHDIDAHVVQELSGLGFPIEGFDDVLAFQIHEIDAEFVEEAMSLGLGDLDAGGRPGFRRDPRHDHPRDRSGVRPGSTLDGPGRPGLRRRGCPQDPRSDPRLLAVDG
jgi:hypothetical protein